MATIEIKDSLIERLQKALDEGAKQGYHDYVPANAEIEALLELEIEKLEREFGLHG